MRTICAWCQLLIDEGSGAVDEPVSHSICLDCAERVLSKDALTSIKRRMLEIIRMQRESLR